MRLEHPSLNLEPPSVDAAVWADLNGQGAPPRKEAVVVAALWAALAVAVV